MKFNNRITEKGFVKKPGTKNVATWHGLRLLTDDEIVNLVKNEPVIVKNETSESYKLNLFNKIPGSSLIRDNEPKLPEKPILEINSEAKSELKVPQKLASDADECPVCGGLNVVFWPDGSVDKKYCTDCFPEWDKEPPF